MKNNTSIRKNFILSMFFQVLNIITPLITAPYISRTLGVEAVGTYSYTSSLQLYFSIFAALGTATYGCRQISINRNDKNKRSTLFWEIELLTIFTGGLSLLFYLILAFFYKSYTIFLLVLSIKLFNTMLDISWFFIGIEQLKYIVFKNAFFKILGIVLLFVLIKQPTDLLLYMIIMCGTTFLGTITMWFYVPKFVNKINIKDIKIFYHFKHTIIYFIPTIATTIYSNIDKTLIGFITKNMDESAYYEEATKILELAKSVTFVALNSLLTSRMSYLFANEKYEEMKEKLKISINYILTIGFAITFGIIAIADRFIPFFFGSKFQPVVFLIQMFIIVIVITGISNCLDTQYYTPAGRRKESTKFIIIGTIINLILNTIFIPFLHAKGAIIASIIAESIILFLYIKNCNQFLTLGYILKSSYKKIFAGVIMLFIIIFTNKYLSSSYISLFLEIIIGAITYFSALILLKDDFVYKYLKSFIREIIKKIKLGG